MSCLFEVRKTNNRFIVYVWESSPDENESSVYEEHVYAEMNQWCIDTLKKHTRTSYNIFEFKKKSDLNWFVLRWQ